MNKPIFRTNPKRGRPPSLQIKILKLIMIQGELSKIKAKSILDSNYADVSGAMDALASNDKQFIKFSRKTGRRRPEKFYKITENGLRALLTLNITPNDFWRVMTLLCICSKHPISHEEFGEHYQRFESYTLGHSAIHGYFFLQYFLDVIHYWLQNISNIATAQIIIECLAINRSITLPELIEKSGLKEDEAITVLRKHTVRTSLDLPAGSKSKASNTSVHDLRKQYYINFISHALITVNKNKIGNTYELSLFGVILMIYIIRYHSVNARSNNLWDDTAKAQFYNNLKPNEYIDRIINNYKEKLPLIFEKWNFLKKQLGGIMLYYTLDFLIYEKVGSQSTGYSVWIEGNREYYDDIKALASNAGYQLSPLYASGRTILDNFQKYRDIINKPRIFPLDRKLREIYEIILYADFPRTQEMPDKDHLSFVNETESQNMNRVKIIEKIFAEELAFLYYLNLNTTCFPGNYMKHPTEPELFMLNKDHATEFFLEERLGSPKDRLMTLLTNDNDIKKWFTKLLQDAIYYRNQTLNKMSKFYDETLDLHNYVKRLQNEKLQHEKLQKNSTRVSVKIEYDTTKICSDFN
jgi:hypothetical protein